MYFDLISIKSQFQAGPLENIRFVTDPKTKRRKPFAFVMYKHEESVPYAISVFRDVKLFGRNLQLQHRTNNSVSDRGRTFSAPPQVFRPEFQNNQMFQAQSQMQQQHMGQQQFVQNYQRQHSHDNFDHRSRRPNRPSDHDRSYDNYQQNDRRSYDQQSNDRGGRYGNQPMNNDRRSYDHHQQQQHWNNRDRGHYGQGGYDQRYNDGRDRSRSQRR